MRNKFLFSSERISVRPFIQSDVNQLLDLMTDKDVMQFIGPRRVMSEIEVQGWLEKKLNVQEEKNTKYAVCLSTGELIGVCGIDKDIGVACLDTEFSGVWDFGYYFRKKYWGQGFATEACKLIVNHLPDNVFIDGVFAFVADGNAASAQVLAKTGFVKYRDTVNEYGESGSIWKLVL